MKPEKLLKVALVSYFVVRERVEDSPANLMTPG
jgi:hypothetical protein